jgi:hypothetical protein
MATGCRVMLLHACTSACLHACMPSRLHACTSACLHVCGNGAERPRLVQRPVYCWFLYRRRVGCCAGKVAALFWFLFCEFRRGRADAGTEANQLQTQAGSGRFRAGCGAEETVPVPLTLHNHEPPHDSFADRSCTRQYKRLQVWTESHPPSLFFAHTRTRVQVGNECRAGHAPIATTI